MLNRLHALVRDYFGLSHKEARGFIVLLFLSFLFLLIPFVYRFLADRKPVDSSPTDQRKLDSLVAIMQAEEAKQPRYGSHSENEKTTSEHFSEPSLFRFDPNTATVAQWQQLGLPRWLAERIEKFRNKGGQFRKKDDLLRIYDFPPELYDQLEPYITLKDAPSSQPFSTPKSYPTEAPATTERPAFPNRFNPVDRPVRPVVQPFDINTADTAQLVALKGIGSTLAGRIVKFRDALGGFVSTEQYRAIYGLDSLAREELLKFGKIQSGVHKIPINTATADELDRHPFLSRRQAQIIVNYREQHGAYTSAESLKPIRLLDAQTIEKIAPYLEF